MSSTLCPGFGLFLCSEVVVSLDFYWCFLWLYVCGSFIFFLMGGEFCLLTGGGVYCS